MLARGALCRLAVDAPKTSPHDLSQLARFLCRTLLARNASKNPAVRALSRAYTQALSSRRSYATTARATQPTATVKKAVKAQAAKKAAPKRKTAAKKTVAKKPVAKKSAARKKAGPKKAAPKKRVKKQLTPELEAKAEIAELRKKALKEPVAPSAVTGFNAYIADMSSGNKASEPGGARAKLAEAAKNWKNLTPAEHEHYNHIANERTAARRAEYKAWVESHTPDQIRVANNARVLLRRRHRQAGTTLKGQSYPAHTAKLVDERHVKKPGSSYLFFSKERWASGDFKSIKTVEASKLIGNEWKALSASEKKKYIDEFAANRDQLASEKATASS